MPRAGACRAALRRSLRWRQLPEGCRPEVVPAPGERLPPLPGGSLGGLALDHFELRLGDGPQETVPMSVMRNPEMSGAPRPAVLFMHATGFCRASLWEWMQSVVDAAGIVAVAVDARFHGQRGVTRGRLSRITSRQRYGYNDALVDAWRLGGERAGHPFLLDNVAEVPFVLDWISEQPFVDPERIGMTGISLGGMHTWLAMVADDRIAVGAPLIGVQNWGWAVEHGRYHGRVASIPTVFEAARADLGEDAVTAEVVRRVWDRILPGLLDVDGYDAAMSLPELCPRPFLIVNGALDPRCPAEGLAAPAAAAARRYAARGVEGNFAVSFEAGVGHAVTRSMYGKATAWLLAHLDSGEFGDLKGDLARGEALLAAGLR